MALSGCTPEPTPPQLPRVPSSRIEDTGYLLAGDTVDPTGGLAGAEAPAALTPGQQIVQVAKVELNKAAGQIGTGVTSYPYDLGRYLAPGEAYCSEFVAWVYKVAGYPLSGGSETGGWMLKSAPALVSWHKSHAQYVDRSSAAWKTFTPAPGDYVYFVWSTGSSHSGIVDHVDGIDLKTVEGNVNKLVLALTRKDWRNYSAIKGFGVRTLGPAPKPDAGAPPRPKLDAGGPTPPAPDASLPPPPPPIPAPDSGLPGAPADARPPADLTGIIRGDGVAPAPGANLGTATLLGGCAVGAAGGPSRTASAAPLPSLGLLGLALLLLVARRRP